MRKTASLMDDDREKVPRLDPPDLSGETAYLSPCNCCNMYAVPLSPHPVRG